MYKTVNDTELDNHNWHCHRHGRREDQRASTCYKSTLHTRVVDRSRLSQLRSTPPFPSSNPLRDAITVSSLQWSDLAFNTKSCPLDAAGRFSVDDFSESDLQVFELLRNALFSTETTSGRLKK